MKTLGLLGVLFGFFCPLAAQHVLVVKDEGKPAVVVAVRGYRPMIMKNGKLTDLDTHEFGLVKTKEYLPVHVTVGGLWAQTSYMTTAEGGGEMNKTFKFNCTLESAYSLEEVFMVIMVNSENIGKSIFVREVGELKARRALPIHWEMPTSENMGAGKFELHIFVKGMEVFNTRLPFGEMNNALNRMIRDRIKDVQDAPAQPFVGPAPEYPKALYKKHVEGRAVLKFKIERDGGITDPEVTEATEPEFGEAALKVIKQWRFLPKVEKGRPVEAKAKMPFVFTPPEK